jgi:hypothetical protein
MLHKAQLSPAPAIVNDRGRPMTAMLGRALPYVLSWGVFAGLMIVGMTRLPLALYTPMDGEWAKWNVEAILHFGKVFDLSPYSMLAGMGSMYFPNLPWLNPGALALALPLDDNARSIASYAVYAAELAISIVLLARTLGFSWLIAATAAQLHLYLLFPPFSDVFHIYDWYSLAPYYAHLLSVLNAATALLLMCGQVRDWRGNVALCIGFLVLFISGLLSAPFTFVFAIPAYAAISAVVILARWPSRAEWAWKMAALALCLIFFFGSGLIDYYLGTIATAGRTPTSAIAWDRLLSPEAWLRLLQTHPLCSDPRLLLCTQNRGAWLEIAALIGAAVAIVTRGGEIRAAAATFIAYIGLAHLYAYAYQGGWLGPVSVLSSHFLILSSWSFMSMFAVVPFFELFRLVKVHVLTPAKRFDSRRLAGLVATAALAAALIVIVFELLAHPHDVARYRAAQLIRGGLAFGGVLLAVELIRAYWSRKISLQPIIVLSIFPILAFVHLSIGISVGVQPVLDPSLRNYLHENASIDLGKPFRGYTTTIWMDKDGTIWPGSREGRNDSSRYINAIGYFRLRYGETFTDADLWQANIPTFEEYGEWTSVQAHAFAARLLAPGGLKGHSNYLRSFTIDTDLLRALGVRFVLTDAEAIDGPATPRGAVAVRGAIGVHLFELSNANLGTYSPTHFVKAATADAIVERIRENKGRLDQVAVVSDDIPAATAQARNVAMLIERDGVRVQATSDGPAHILLPIQFSHCLVIVNGAAARLARANLFQTLLSFDGGAVNARIEFRFGLFADNSCRLRDGRDNKALGL